MSTFIGGPGLFGGVRDLLGIGGRKEPTQKKAKKPAPQTGTVFDDYGPDINDRTAIQQLVQNMAFNRFLQQLSDLPAEQALSEEVIQNALTFGALATGQLGAEERAAFEQNQLVLSLPERLKDSSDDPEAAANLLANFYNQYSAQTAQLGGVGEEVLTDEDQLLADFQDQTRKQFEREERQDRRQGMLDLLQLLPGEARMAAIGNLITTPDFRELFFPQEGEETDLFGAPQIPSGPLGLQDRLKLLR